MRKLLVAVLLFALASVAAAHAFSPQSAGEKVIFDTDIGDDVDDAYALALLLRSPEIRLLGVTTAFGDTHLRARLVSRFLEAAGRTEVAVYEGPATPPKGNFSQSRWAQAAPERTYPDAIAFTLDTIRRNPGQVTLLSVAPLTNVGVLLRKDPATFRKLKRVVLMGGSIRRGYGENAPPSPEWNILNDVAAARLLFSSGVPVFVMPLDSTQIPLDADRQAVVFGKQTALSSALQELTAEWSASARRSHPPVLFDALTAAFLLRPQICPVTPMRIEVDDHGLTRAVEGKPNAEVCLSSSAEDFFSLSLPRFF
jgi:inosine-uridine nucleoside N-ribohydrolase